MARIDAIYRYPVKGFTPERLPRVTLTARATLPLDRAYAVENGPSSFDPQKPQYFPKIRFLEADAQRAAGGASHVVRRRRATC